ncbi:putative bifunctional diguanylate cyclase/phosphodiesterase [Texcoconibacillus texcoconensis]|uniref:Diguanylate cyclase (GGDEF)-like protein/PAS domain S-box-containing protein n=1 Tax=Texcoconibacillus texcoconensis TaxID=1095777 RepID=A0A840QTC3_9BACI|nr:GGDEF domain-containing phosphodiesterase [Texcoconibacillus texcoconensis]MBB5174615.1 diguanylate cyclase (GGDEF)-like protein/PAS domain S-box-containing protein [Texcoconibacillus texcoconensis]
MKKNLRKNILNLINEKDNIYQMLHNMNDGLIVTDGKERIIAINPAFERITGYSSEEVQYFTPRILQSGLTPSTVYQDMWQTLKEKGTWTGELVNRRKNGDIYHSFMTMTRIENVNENEIFYIGIVRDITERKKIEQTANELTHYDELTRLPNRRHFEMIATNESEEAKKQNRPIALLFLNIDSFKVINDSIGHHHGDVLLQIVAQKLQEIVGDDGVIARFSGDEFLILLTNIHKKEDITPRIDQIHAEISEGPINIANQSVHVKFNIGISIYPYHAIEVKTLMKHAHIALSHAKSDNQNDYRYFDQIMSGDAYEQFTIANELHDAIENDELIPFYQIKYDIKNNKTYGVEALVRWEHPKRGMLSPKDFISIAEATGLIADIDSMVLKKALHQAQTWRQTIAPDLHVSVNISQQQFEQKQFTNTITQALNETGIDPSAVILEVTESVALTHVNDADEKLQQLRQLGVNIAIDDFGTGYSSLHQIKSLPIDMIKIDRSFIKESNGQDQDAAIVRTIIALANNLGCQVTCEGIEENEQLTFIKNERCDYAQGYLFNRPQPANDVTKLLTS